MFQYMIVLQFNFLAISRGIGRLFLCRTVTPNWYKFERLSLKGETNVYQGSYWNIFNSLIFVLVYSNTTPYISIKLHKNWIQQVMHLHTIMILTFGNFQGRHYFQGRYFPILRWYRIGFFLSGLFCI